MKTVAVSYSLKTPEQVTYKIHAPWANRWLLKDTFVVDFGCHVEHLPPSLLLVPGVASAAVFAWMMGAAVVAESLDVDFYKKLVSVHKEMCEWAPNQFSGAVEVGKLKDNSKSSEKTGMLFTGGVDSTFTLSEIIHEKPTLFTIRGMQKDHIGVRSKYWVAYRGWLEKQSRRYGLDHKFVSSDSRLLFNEAQLEKDFSVSWWLAAHSVMMLGTIAPIAYIANIGKITIASTWTAGFKNFWGSHPRIDNKISWAGTTVYHHGFEFSRIEKIQKIASTVQDFQLVVCPFACPTMHRL